MILQAPTRFYIHVKIATRGNQNNEARDINKVFWRIVRKQSTTRELLFTLEAVKSRIDISENQISNVVDEGKINT